MSTIVTHPGPPGGPPKLSPSTRHGAPTPKNPWAEHLRSLIDQNVIVKTMGPAELIEFEGRLLAVSDQHLNCAILRADNVVVTVKNVHHILSHPKARGPR
jgi:hypothetical protein